MTGVWIGNDDNSPMNKATGSGLPVDIWARFMKAAHQGVPFAPPPITVPAAPELFPRSVVPDIQGTAPVASVDAPRPRGNALDTWSIDRLFSRR